MFSLSDLLPTRPTVRVLDLGAAETATSRPSYQALLDRQLCEIVAVEARGAAVVETVPRNPEVPIRVVDATVGDGNIRPFYECELATRSSLLYPNLAFCARYDGYATGLAVHRSKMVKTITLDSLAHLGPFDLLKSDLQGGDLMAFENGTLLLREALVVEVEAEFVPQYVDQPRFSEIEIHLRKQGLQFCSFTEYGTRPLRGWRPQRLVELRSSRQWLWATALFIPRLDRIDTLSPDRLLSLAVILHDVYGAYDCAGLALDCYDRHTGAGLGSIYPALLERSLADSQVPRSEAG